MSSKRVFVFPGSFDPPTFGHLDIIKRASCRCDILYVAILNNASKDRHLFSLKERIGFLQAMTKDLQNVSVVSFDGLLVDFCDRYDCSCIVKGVRNITDFEYELNMADINAELSAHKVDTIFFPAKKEYSHVSSSLVRELIQYHADISGFVHGAVISKIEEGDS